MTPRHELGCDRDTVDDWDLHWEQFAAYASENPAQAYRHSTLLRLLERLKLCNNTRLLDVGSGQGDFLARIAKVCPSVQLAGIELSEKAVLITVRKVPNARVFAADLFAPPPDLNVLREWADVAVCCEVLEHLDNPARFLSAVAHYCAKNAKLLVTVPGGPISSFDRHIGHRRHFTARELQLCLENAGWGVLRIFRAGFPFFNIYRTLVVARGARLSRDLTAGQTRALALGRVVMRLFRILFRANLLNSPFGWQLIALAGKR